VSILVFLAGALSCLATLYFFAIRRKQNEWGIRIMMNIETGKTAPISFVLTRNGVDVPTAEIPTGTTVVWNQPVDTVGSGSGTLAPESNPVTADLTGGPADDAGEITVAATLPNGKVLTSEPFPFTVIAAMPDGVRIVEGLPQ
jgi:hypothetical protein